MVPYGTVTTRSRVLVSTLLDATKDNLLYVCPTDRVVLVKSIALVRYGATPSKVALYLNRPNPAGFAYILVLEPSDAYSVPIEVWVVMEPRDELRHDPLSEPVGLWLSGTELPLPY